MRAQDPRELLSRSPMSGIQIAAVAITVGLTALDGFDVLSISFASPGIAKEWGIDRGAAAASGRLAPRLLLRRRGHGRVHPHRDLLGAGVDRLALSPAARQRAPRRPSPSR